MDDEKEIYVGPVEKEINSMMGAAGNEIMGLNQKEIGTREEEISEKIHMVNLNRCIIYLARQIDKLANSIE